MLAGYCNVTSGCPKKTFNATESNSFVNRTSEEGKVVNELGELNGVYGSDFLCILADSSSCTTADMTFMLINQTNNITALDLFYSDGVAGLQPTVFNGDNKQLLKMLYTNNAIDDEMFTFYFTANSWGNYIEFGTPSTGTAGIVWASVPSGSNYWASKWLACTLADLQMKGIVLDSYQAYNYMPLIDFGKLLTHV